MKKIFLVVIVFSIANFIQAQETEKLGCSHQNSFQAKTDVKGARVSQAEELNDYDIHYVKLDLQANNTSIDLEGSAEIHAISQVDNLELFVLELIDELIVDSVLVEGVKQDFTHESDLININLSTSIAKSSGVAVKVFYHAGSNFSSNSVSGIYNEISPTWGNQATFTLSEHLYAKQWWPSKQKLSDKIDSVDFFVTTPDHLTAASNGLVTVVPLPNSKLRHEWRTRYPINYYLISMSIAEYVEYNIFADITELDEPLLVQNYIYNNPETLPYFKAHIDQVPAMLEFFSEQFGVYPFHEEKYGHAMAPLGGGMEHQTMTTLGGFNFNLDAHELGHQWFGNNVTCATWQDIWVNEGFASYTEYLAIENLQNDAAASEWLQKAHEYAKEYLEGSVYVPEVFIESDERVFDYRLSYKKGGSIVHMIRYELNDDEVFFDVLQQFQQIYKDSVATGLDFKKVLEDVSGMDFTDFFNQWYFGEGFPKYSVEWGYANDTLYINSSQVTTADVTDLFKMTLDYKLYFEDGGDSTVRVKVTQNDQDFKILSDRKVTHLVLNPKKDLLMDIHSFRYVELNDDPVVTGVPIAGEDEIRIFPNPNTGMFTISQLPKDVIGVQILDLEGKLVFNQELNNWMEPKLEIDIQLKPGIYLLSIQSNQLTTNQKIILH